MRRNCGKLLTSVGALPNSMSCHCVNTNCPSFIRGFATLTVSPHHSDKNEDKGESHWKSPFRSSFPLPVQVFTNKENSTTPTTPSVPPPWRRPSTFCTSSTRRYYSSDSSKDRLAMMDRASHSSSTTNTHAQSNSNSISSTTSVISETMEVGGTGLHLSSFPSQNQSGCSITSPSSLYYERKDYSSDYECNGKDFNASSGSSSSLTSSSTTKVAQASASTSAMLGLGTPFTPVRTVVTSQRLIEVCGEPSTMEQPKLMTKDEREEFMSLYHTLVRELMEIPDMKDMEETNRWMARVLQYNVPHGKRNRGLSTALAYKYLAPAELTEENVRLSYVLGWCAEILQAFFLVSDDIMDGSETRRGRPCWYKVDNLGLAAINDALLLESTIYKILQKHFSGKSCYANVLDVMHDVTYKTIFGQSLDTRTGLERRMETYTMERYSSIVKYKTSYYSFYLPVALAMAMCDISDPKIIQQVKKVTLEMGHFFQVQDDYLDCFGDVEVTGKIGTDIQDCKCSWLFVIATQRCNPDQKKFLMENYGKNDPAKIEAVTELYRKLDLEGAYHTYEEQTYNMICTHIEQMNPELPKGLFYDMLHKIYKRSS